MADRKTGIADEINLVRESDSENLTDELGIISNVDWTINLPEDPRSSVGNSPTLQAAIEQLGSVELRVEVEASDFRAFKLQGTYTDNGDGTYDLTLDDRLPYFTAKLEVTETTDNLEFTGIKFLTATLTIEDSQPVSIVFEGVGKDAQLLDESVTTPSPENPSQFLDAFMQLGGTDVAAVNSASIVYDRSQGRDTGAVKGLTNSSASNRRNPDEIIEGNKLFNWDATVQITDRQAFEETFNSTSQPYGLSDATTRTSMTIVINDGDDNFELSDAKISENSGQLTNDAGEIRTVDLSGNSFDATVSGNT